MDPHSNLTEMRGGGLDPAVLDPTAFVAQAAGGGPTGLSVPFLASAPAGTVLARLTTPRGGKGGWDWRSAAGLTPPYDLPGLPPQLAFVSDVGGGRILRGSAAAVAGTTYTATLLAVGHELENDRDAPRERIWRFAIPMVAG